MALMKNIVNPECGSRLHFTLEVKILKKRLANSRNGASFEEVKKEIRAAEFGEYLLCERNECFFLISKALVMIVNIKSYLLSVIRIIYKSLSIKSKF